MPHFTVVPVADKQRGDYDSLEGLSWVDYSEPGGARGPADPYEAASAEGECGKVPPTSSPAALLPRAGPPRGTWRRAEDVRGGVSLALGLERGPAPSPRAALNGGTGVRMSTVTRGQAVPAPCRERVV
ncbi:hypothetical protein KIL84_005446 [Mauremys mutica]|uniref:Uncharacterized protein n=1 Tax=Mauremys mutica TaxID=74926 RepID=A0A9D3XMA7_9SAUR|nr:hypothetical protein KIL84_005446 [Mauremys mutica]